MAGMDPDLAFNTAVSFTTNTNWQSYSGEAALSYLSQMAGLTVQNFVSAATGVGIDELLALIEHGFPTPGLHPNPPLTTVRQPVSQLGELAAERLVPWGRRLVRPAGLLLILLGTVMILSTSSLIV